MGAGAWHTIRRLMGVVVSATALGAAIYTIAWFARNYTFVGDVAAQSRDAVLALRADIEAPQQLHSPIIFIAIDEQTYRELGRKEEVPAEAIDKILKAVGSAKPQLIVLDVDLSARRDPQDVHILTGALEFIRRQDVPLLLVRSTPPHSSGEYSVSLHASPYDQLIAEAPTLTWASGEAVVSQGTIQGVSSWVPSCIDGKPEFLVGVAPLAMEIVYAHVRNLHALKAGFSRSDWRCSGRSAVPSSKRFTARFGGPNGTTASLSNDRDRLVHCSLRWRGPEWTSSQVVTRRDGHKRPLFSVIPARQILMRGNDAIRATGDLFDQAIVFVGASNIAAGDIQPTPIGEMPGAMILINHVRGFLDFGPEGPDQFFPGLWVLLAMSATTGLCIGVVARWTSSWGGLVLPVLFTLMWWAAAALVLGGTGYFALAIVQFVVGIATAVLFPREKRTQTGEK